MTKTLALCWAGILALGILAGASWGFAQEPETKSETQTTNKTKTSWDSPLEQYHLDFSINEIEDGKKINSRQYSMNLATNEGNEIKIGTRVPVEPKEGQFQYLDVGTNIFARIGETRGQQQLRVNAEVSNFAMPDPNQEKRDPHPIVRQIKMGGSILLPAPAKAFVIGSADDPNSKRQFQLEVTVTKLK
jgi:hypothetical protein